MVAPRSGKRQGPDIKLLRATESAKLKITPARFEKLRASYVALSAATARNRKKLEDGMIMALIQQNLSCDQIRSVFGCGNSRIKRIRNIMKEPTLLDKKRPSPKHAVRKEDLENLKEHLSGYDTEDGFPCAHRRPRKFLIVQGLT